MITKNFRPNQISVNLLKNQNENGENQCVAGINHKKDQNAGDSPDKRTKKWKNIRNAYDNTDQNSIFHIRDQHEDITQNADNHGINNLTGNKPAENGVGSANPEDQCFCRSLPENGITSAFASAADPFFFDQKMTGNNETYKQLKYK